MIHKIKIYILTVIILFVVKVSAQQDPQFTHYMYNMSVLNPAYATDNADVINFGGLYRAQWVGIEGAPTTQTFFVHKPVSKRVELGLSIIHDEIGNIVNENNIFVDFAYVLPLSETVKLSLGLKAGVTLFDTNFNGLVLNNPLPDPAFQNNISRSYPNVGVGTYLFGSNYYFGLSAPNLMTSRHIETINGNPGSGVEAVHFFMTGGYVFQVNDNIKIKPAFMSKAVEGTPISIDLTTNVLINNKFEAGIGYRMGDSVSGLASFYITSTLRMGYSYDYTLTNLSAFNSGSHEVFLLFDLNTSKSKGYDKSPRFF